MNEHFMNETTASHLVDLSFNDPLRELARIIRGYGDAFRIIEQLTEDARLVYDDIARVVHSPTESDKDAQ